MTYCRWAGPTCELISTPRRWHEATHGAVFVPRAAGWPGTSSVKDQQPSFDLLHSREITKVLLLNSTVRQIVNNCKLLAWWISVSVFTLKSFKALLFTQISFSKAICLHQPRVLLKSMSKLNPPPPSLVSPSQHGILLPLQHVVSNSVYFCPLHTLFQGRDRVPFVRRPESDV